MTLLSKDQILAAAASVVAAQSEDVPCPELGGALRVRALTGFEMDNAVAQSVAGEGKAARIDGVGLKYRVLAAAIVDTDGIAIFSGDEVRALPRKVIARLYDAANRLNAEGDAREAVEKNSNSEPTADSGSGSRSPSAALS